MMTNSDHAVCAARGNQFPVDAAAHAGNVRIQLFRELHRRLVYEKVPHEYIERPGAHTWAYWGNALEYHLLFFQKVLTR
mgnify:CR=1 FL=1